MIEVAWVILEIYALKKCLSFPGKGGLLSIGAFKFPVNMYLIYFAAAMWFGLASGS